jgi:hypothetical protein
MDRTGADPTIHLAYTGAVVNSFHVTFLPRVPRWTPWVDPAIDSISDCPVPDVHQLAYSSRIRV